MPLRVRMPHSDEFKLCPLCLDDQYAAGLFNQPPHPPAPAAQTWQTDIRKDQESPEKGTKACLMLIEKAGPCSVLPTAPEGIAECLLVLQEKQQDDKLFNSFLSYNEKRNLITFNSDMQNV